MDSLFLHRKQATKMSLQVRSLNWYLPFYQFSHFIYSRQADEALTAAGD